MTHQLDFSVSYRYDSTKGGITIPTVVAARGFSVDCFAKVDTGADFCLFQRTVGELLKLDLFNGQPIRFNTLAGNFVAYGHEVTLRAFGLTFDTTVYFAESHSVTRNLPGRHGFLQNIQLGLRDHDELLYLSKYDELMT